MLHNYNKKILVIDHDMNFQMKLKMQLLKLGINIDFCSTIEDGLMSLEAETPNLIFLEICLPNGKAFNFLKIRGQNSILKKIPLILVTQIKTKEILQKALQYGANDIIFKPINMTTMLSKLEKYFNSENQVYVEYISNRPSVEISLKVTMLALGKNMIQIQGPIRLPKDKTLVNVDIPIFVQNQIPLKACINVEESKFVTTMKYNSLLQFIGTNLPIGEKIESLVVKSSNPKAGVESGRS